jgi:hypothetical protein
VTVSTGGVEFGGPTVTSGFAGQDRFGITYGRFVDEPPYHADRALFRTFAKQGLAYARGK